MLYNGPRLYAILPPVKEQQAMSATDILDLIEAHDIKFVDLRFIDIKGKEQHVTVPTSIVDETFLIREGKAFDGSSLAGWKGINDSDMLLMPDVTTSFLDPFCEIPTMVLRCDVIEPITLKGYNRDPRYIAKCAEAYLQQTGIADTCLIGPEPEFFIFDDVRWTTQMNHVMFSIDSEEAAWNSHKLYEGGNMGHRPVTKGGYFPVPPVDSSQDIRSAICQTLEQIGIATEAHHHEVATANQNEVATRFNSLVKKADELMNFKYVVHNVTHTFGKSATFMPKPLVGDNGNGMHCHISLTKKGDNLFAGSGYAGLSDTALYFIGGVIKHARALNAFTNPGTNSYKRLVPGFEAPVMLAYSARNRSASIRVPYTSAEKARRIEVRFPDPTANAYLAFAAILMAGLDGIANKIHPGEPIEEDLYHLPAAQMAEIPTVCHSLDQALESLAHDRAFLLKGDVFSNDFIDSYVKLKMDDVHRMRMATHPLEFEMYYSL